MIRSLAASLLVTLVAAPVVTAEASNEFDRCETEAPVQADYRCFGTIAGRTGAWDEAIRRLERLETGDPTNPLIVWALAYVRQHGGDLEKAEESYLRTAELFDAEGNPAGVSVLLYLYTLWLQQGRIEEALGIVERAARAADGTGDATLIAQATIVRASAALMMHRPAEAERLLVGVKAWIEESAPPWLELLWLQSSILLRYRLGEQDEAAELLERSIEICRSQGNRFEEAAERYSLALIGFNGPGTPADKRVPFQEVLKLARESGNRFSEASSLVKLGELADDPVQGRALIRKGLALHVEAGSAQGILESRIALATDLALRVPEAFEEARAILHEEMDQAVAQGQHRNAVWVSYILSCLLWERATRLPTQPNWRQDAMEWGLRSIESIEAWRDLQIDTLARARTIKVSYPTFEVLVGRLLREADDGNEASVAVAFELMERMRARMLLDELDAAGARSWGTGPLANRRADVLREIASVQRSLLGAGAAVDANDDRLNTLRKLELEERDLRARLAEENPVVAMVRRPRTATLEEVQDTLRDDEAMLVYQLADWTGDQGYFGGGAWLLTITADSARAYRLDDASVVGPSLTMYTSVLTDTGSAPPEGSARLYRDLIGAALDELPISVRRLIIVADDALHGLPFGTLRASSTAMPLAMQYEIVAVPSATVWRRWRGQENPRFASPALAFADPTRSTEPIAADRLALRDSGFDDTLELGPLPYARREGEELIRRLSDGSKLLAGGEATEARLKSVELGRFNILHFATHATIDHDLPERSGVLLSPGDPAEDGLLQMREIVELNLDGQTVVLSSCRSASGKVFPGEGVMGLAQAFFVGGAATVIGSLWPLKDDEAAIFFEAFYRNLARGVSTSEALTAARRERIEAGASDAAWAGIVLLGDGTRVPFPGGVSRGLGPWLLAATLTTVLGAFLAILAMRRRRAIPR